jgi:protein-disulfide isomerase
MGRPGCHNRLSDGDFMKKIWVFAAAFFLSSAALAAPADTAKAVRDYAKRAEMLEAQDRDQRAAAIRGALEDNPGSPFIGHPQADVTIVEFFDYACPYCKAVEPRLTALVQRDRGVKLVLKEFPILTRQSMIASRMALAAMKQGKYAPFHLAMMRHLGPLEVSDIEQMAKASGLDVARLKRDMVAPEVTDEIIANFNQARAIRAFQTPAFIVNGHVLGSESANINFPAEVAAARKRANP